MDRDINKISKYINRVENLWQRRYELVKGTEDYKMARRWLQAILDDMDKGIVRACEKKAGQWHINSWVKRAILLYFRLYDSVITSSYIASYYDKIPLKFDPSNCEEEDFKENKRRVLPGAIIRKGSYIGTNTVIMPSFINIGAYIGNDTMIDTWSSVGSCVYVGNRCHISGGVGLAGVLEPEQSSSVIIEDDCFIGARSEIAEGVVVEQGSVIAMGVYIGASTKIVNRQTGEITYGRVPANSVVVSGTMPDAIPERPGLACAVIIKQVDEKTRSKTSINELLRC